MRAVFADTGYWVAVIHPHDGLHEQAMAVSAQLGECSLVSSEMVLVEVLNTFSGRGQHLREAASRTVREITADPNVDPKHLSCFERRSPFMRRGRIRIGA
jgi:uncharacterized protein